MIEVSLSSPSCTWAALAKCDAVAQVQIFSSVSVVIAAVVAIGGLWSYWRSQRSRGWDEYRAVVGDIYKLTFEATDRLSDQTAEAVIADRAFIRYIRDHSAFLVRSLDRLLNLARFAKRDLLSADLTAAAVALKDILDVIEPALLINQRGSERLNELNAEASRLNIRKEEREKANDKWAAELLVYNEKMAQPEELSEEERAEFVEWKGWYDAHVFNDRGAQSRLLEKLMDVEVEQKSLAQEMERNREAVRMMREIQALVEASLPRLAA